MMKALLIGTTLAATLFAGPVLARDAYCYSSDEGEYDCNFIATASDGSFRISAPGYTTYSLVIERPGVAWVYATYRSGSDAVALPGPYRRSQNDGACWVNRDTDAEICAW